MFFPGRGHRFHGGRRYTQYCWDRGDWVTKSEVCVNCDKYGKWEDGIFECRDDWEWHKQFEKYMGLAESEEGTDYGEAVVEDPAEEPDQESDDETEPLTEYGQILRRWFEEEQKNQVDGEEEADAEAKGCKDDTWDLSPEGEMMRHNIGTAREEDEDGEDGEHDEEEDVEEADDEDDEDEDDGEEDEDDEDL